MKIIKIPYHKTNKFKKLIIDYLNEDEKLKKFINHFPTIESIEEQIKEKSKHEINRVVLFETLKLQNSKIFLSERSKNNLESILSKNTYTVTTGHQLCLFTGPLYFIYKIISTINLTERLAKKYPNNNFIPLFWMASEDHDFLEINHINVFKKKIEWNNQEKGAVGRMNLNGLEEVIDELKNILGENSKAKKLISVFKDAYLRQSSLSDATRFLINELFGKYGLLIIDSDDSRLKQEFVATIKKDLLKKGFYTSIKKCSNDLSKEYKVQAFPRDINFFKLSDGKREKIEDNVLKQDIQNNPSKFSPNVLMRPIYQETILPNLAYIGGSSEISYWMQLKYAFSQENIPFPILVLRNSAMILDEKQFTIINKLGFTIDDLFLEEKELQKAYVINQGDISLSLEKEILELREVYQKIMKKTIDKGLIDHIKASCQKHINELEKLEKKLLKAKKQKYKQELNQITKLKLSLFPDGGLQERYDNFTPFYLKKGENFIKTMKEILDPLNPNFVVLVL